MTIETAIRARASDFELISEYARCGSEQAFGQIVGRYIDLVHAAAVRQVRDSHLAEEVTQAVFLILSQRAGTIGAETVLAGWFLLTTRNVARNALRSEWRLKRRERKVAQMHGEEDNSGKKGNEAVTIGPALDNAMARLNEADRDAILLRFFHSKSHREVGQALGLSEEAAGKRVARAIGKLREILTRSGVTASEATLTSALPMLVGKAAPHGLATAIQASLTAGAASPGVAALASGSAAAAGGGSAGMTWAIGAIAAVVLLGAGTYTAMTLLAEPKQSAATPTTAAAPAAPAAPLDSRTITIQTIDPQTNQPVSGADVQLRFGGNQRRTGKTDANGRMAIGVPTNLNDRDVQIIVSAAGRVPMQMMWNTSRLRGNAPALVTVPLETGTTIGGTVCDATGNPVEGARVKVLVGNFDSFEAPSPVLDREDILTDAQGRWQINNAPSNLKQIWVMPVHPNFPGSESESMPMVDVGKLRNQTLISTIRAVATKV
ncbi:MAG TPA: sigma-70 family RNA polymerase sigma factor, partial [Tepidisphaeraceae bacterium]